MAPRRLFTKHYIIQLSPGKLLFSKVYYEWSSSEEDAIGQEETKEAIGGKIDGDEENKLESPFKDMKRDIPSILFILIFLCLILMH